MGLSGRSPLLGLRRPEGVYVKPGPRAILEGDMSVSVMSSSIKAYRCALGVSNIALKCAGVPSGAISGTWEKAAGCTGAGWVLDRPHPSMMLEKMMKTAIVPNII